MTNQHVLSILNRYLPEPLCQQLSIVCEKIGITRLSRLTKLDKTPIETWSACRPDSLLWQSSAGKGQSTSKALISCIVESYEGYISESYLRGHYLPSEITTPFQCIDKALIYAETTKLLGILDPGLPDIKQWTPALELKSNQHYYVPLHWAFLCSSAIPYGWVTNGLSAGPTQQHVRSHGLLELLERHYLSTCFFQKKMLRQSYYTLPPEYLNQSIFKHINDSHTTLNPFFLFVANASVPTCWCILFDDSPIASNLLVNFGSKSHYSIETCILESFSEACQQRASQIQGTREDLSARISFFDNTIVSKLYRFVQTLERRDPTSLKPLTSSNLFNYLPGPVFEITLPSEFPFLFASKFIAPHAQFNKSLF